MSEQQLIDIHGVIKAKNPKLLKFIPKWAIRFVERLVHVEDLNEILTLFGHLNGVEFVNATLKHLRVSYTVLNPERIPANDGQRYIFVSNHPLGGLDGMVIISAIGAHFNNKVKFIVNDLLLNFKPLETVFVPVNKHGRQSSGYADRIDETYRSDNQVLYFPAGICSRRIKGEIKDLEWKKSVVNKSVKYQRSIVPIYFVGQNSNFFYRLANLRKRLGIKANIEMTFLSKELFKKRGSHFELIVGEPIPHSAFDNTKTANEWASYLMEKTYSLAPKKPKKSSK